MGNFNTSPQVTTTVRLVRRLRAAGVRDRGIAHALAAAATVAAAEREIGALRSHAARDHAWRALARVRGPILPAEPWEIRDDSGSYPIGPVSAGWDADTALAHAEHGADCYESPCTPRGREIEYSVRRRIVGGGGPEWEDHDSVYLTTGDMYDDRED